jgi:hypothetical protein
MFGWSSSLKIFASDNLNNLSFILEDKDVLGTTFRALLDFKGLSHKKTDENAPEPNLRTTWLVSVD